MYLLNYASQQLGIKLLWDDSNKELRVCFRKKGFYCYYGFYGALLIELQNAINTQLIAFVCVEKREPPKVGKISRTKRNFIDV